MLRALLCCVALLALAAAPASAGQWVAGDLHVHTTFSHDSWGGPGDDSPTDPTEYYTLGQTVTEDFAIAKARGLDYLAITDHNDIRSQSDPGFGFGGVLGIPAYENSLQGHAQMLGATKLYDNGDSSAAAIVREEAALHADGGVFQANHPMDPLWSYQYDVPVDDVEVWNLPWYYQPALPAASDNEGALRYWEGWLDRGAHVTATGGSDSHWKATLAAQGPGQPTTWIHVDALTVKGVLAGLREGHTFISSEPPAMAGTKVFLEGRVHGLWSALPGDTVRPGTPLRVRVIGAPGATLRVVSDHQSTVIDVPVTSASFTQQLRAPKSATYAFAEVFGPDTTAQQEQLCQAVPSLDIDGETTYCRNRIAMLALSSAIYLHPTGHGRPATG
ncbi:MAG: hypothetical protein JWM71_979 [Solirubrobacteraceae bacterium]|nr:hypothetical protein [Solirubrobacteraceae bacterium]